MQNAFNKKVHKQSIDEKGGEIIRFSACMTFGIAVELHRVFGENLKGVEARQPLKTRQFFKMSSLQWIPLLLVSKLVF